VKTVKTGDEEEKVSVRLLNGVFVVMHVGAEGKRLGASIPQFHRLISTHVGFIFDVLVDRQRVKFGLVRVFSILDQLDAMLAILQ
jgi:hypothetical protein